MSEMHTFAGITFPGRPEVKKILSELERQQAARVDFVTNSTKMELRILDKQIVLKARSTKEDHIVPMTKRVFTQLASWMGIRQTDRLYKWLAHGSQNPGAVKKGVVVDPTANWRTWVTLVNDFMHTEKEYRLIRLMKNEKKEQYCRALLSDKYKVISNADFFYAIVDKLKEAKAEIWHARLSEDKFYGYAVSPGITGQVSTDRPFDPGDGWTSRWYGKKGDVFNAALAFGNSETGEGGLFLNQAILRRVCVNYCVWHDIVNQAHLGKRQGTDTMLSDETIRKANEVLFMKLTDYVRGTFQPEKFQEMLDAMDKATKEHIPDPDKAAEALQIVYGISEERKNAIRNLFVQDGDASRYGLHNAVTAFAHNDALDPDVGFGLEKLGRELIEIPMDRILARAEKMKKEKEDKKETAAVAAPVGSLDE